MVQKQNTYPFEKKHRTQFKLNLNDNTCNLTNSFYDKYEGTVNNLLSLSIIVPDLILDKK